jgi:hypothetical protein
MPTALERSGDFSQTKTTAGPSLWPGNRAHPRRQQVWRRDLRPSDQDTISIKYQTWWTKSVGWEVAGRSSPGGLVRQRYDFTSDDGKVDYTRIISPQMVNEFAIGVHYTTENGPPEEGTSSTMKLPRFRSTRSEAFTISFWRWTPRTLSYSGKRASM